MKGLANVKSFLSSGKPLSKDSLPACDVDRDALIHVMWELYNENTSLKAKVAGAPLNIAGAASPLNAAGTPLKAAGTSVPSNAAGDMTPQNATAAATTSQSEPNGAAALSASAATFVPQKTSSEKAEDQKLAQNAATAEKAEDQKPESQRLCRSMWGYKECPKISGQECERKHLPICDRPVCYSSSPEQWKLCQETSEKWHGHIKAAHVTQKKRERLEAKNKKQEAEQKEYSANRKAFLEWNKNQGNGQTPSVRGKPRKKTQEGHSTQSHKNKENPRGQRRPAARRLGDFLPKRDFPPLPQRGGHPTYQPAPVPKKQAWAKPVNTSQAALPGAREQILDLLKGINVLLRQGAF